jgi:hypothetical protein
MVFTEAGSVQTLMQSRGFARLSGTVHRNQLMTTPENCKLRLTAQEVFHSGLELHVHKTHIVQVLQPDDGLNQEFAIEMLDHTGNDTIISCHKSTFHLCSAAKQHSGNIGVQITNIQYISTKRIAVNIRDVPFLTINVT